MIMSEKSKQHVDSCRFCWMCHHICPIGNATGQERNTARARALGISLVNRGAIGLGEIIDNIYECATCGACLSVCTTGWDPVMFTKEARLQAAIDGVLPEYINILVDNCLNTGNAYGGKTLCADLSAAIQNYESKTDTLLLLGSDVRFGGACKLGVKAIKVLAAAGVSFTVLADEPESGAQLDFLIGAAEETKSAMKNAADVMNKYKTVVVYDPADAKAIKQTYKEYGVEVSASVITFTSFVSSLIKDGKLKAKDSGKTVVFQDPYQLSRDLEEEAPAREIVQKFATLHEMLLHGKETVWAGNILMAKYMPDVINKVATRRIFNAESIGEKIIVTACPGEYVSLKNAADGKVEILSLEDLILG